MVKSMTSKSRFEINWPLGEAAGEYSFVAPLLQSRKICRLLKWMVGPKYKYSAYSLCFFYCFFGKR